MRKFNQQQVTRISEVFGNIAVAWFSAGVIAPLFLKSPIFLEFLQSFGVSLVMTVAFLAISIFLIRRKI